MTRPVSGFRRLLAALEAPGMPYLVGGSLASSIHGVARATMDVDLLVELRPAEARDLAAALGPEFHADAATIADAVRAGRSFNIIHYASTYKFAIFPATRPFHREQLARRTLAETELSEGECLMLPVATAEDIILAKLEWYRQGGAVSERQWQDVLGVGRQCRGWLDLEYLRRWAGELLLRDLLELALADAGYFG